ncbi:preprotein translocase subunit SecG [Mariniblastus sp.]|nr:preprotein translocase subunit SecG [Mariniblastus sp.]
MILAQFQLVENSLLLSEFRFGLFVMEILLFMCSLFLMALVLVQRGKGGGLTGALGGMGGQSAFGSKAGDAFTKITIVTAAIWIFLCMMTIALFNPPPAPASQNNGDAVLNGTMGEAADPDSDSDTDTKDASADEEGGDAEPAGESIPDETTDTDSSKEATDSSKEATEAPPNTSGEAAETKSDVEEK